MALLPIVQNLVASGMTESDIGVIVGFQGKNSDDWLNELKRHHPEVVDAYKAGRQIADSIQVAQMYKSAIGYDYEEVDEEWEVVQDKTDPTKLYEVKVGEKRKHRHQPGNAQLAIFLATNRMPEQFKNRVETTKKSFIINGKVELSGDQIERLAGKLFDEARQVKQIESIVVEAEHGIEPREGSTISGIVVVSIDGETSGEQAIAERVESGGIHSMEQ